MERTLLLVEPPKVVEGYLEVREALLRDGYRRLWLGPPGDRVADLDRTPPSAVLTDGVEADVIVESEYRLPFQEHAYLQPEAGLAYIDEEGRVTVQVAGQWTHEDQEQIAHALRLPKEQIRVIYPAIGGAFGGREDMSVQIVLALAAWKLKRPVKIVWTREESIIGHHKRHPMILKSRWGASKEGKILAADVEVYADGGAYMYTSTKVLGNATLMCTGPYHIPNVKVDAYAVYTNNIPNGAFRGFGAPQARHDCADYRQGHLVLQRKDILDLTVITFGPNLRPGRRVGQLTGDAQVVSGLANASFKNVTHAELASDLFDIDSFALVGEARIAGDDKKAFDSREAADDVFDHAVGEIFLLGIAAHVGERQHADRQARLLDGRARCRRLRRRADREHLHRSLDVAHRVLADEELIGDLFVGEAAGDQRSACMQRINVASGYMDLGSWEHAITLLREALPAAALSDALYGATNAGAFHAWSLISLIVWPAAKLVILYGMSRPSTFGTE